LATPLANVINPVAISCSPLRSALEAAGFGVCGEAANGLDAISQTKDLMPDLIILNLSLPVIHGLEAIREIAKSAPNVKILIFSVDDADEVRRETLRRGAHGYVSKSSPIADLVSEVKRLLA
jgi:DNA-binding NarL/FixJ family response regulator